MNAVTSLICANIGLWLGFAVYFLLLSKKQRQIERQIKILSEQMDIT